MSGKRAPPGDPTIIQLNADHFRRLLDTTTLDPTTRQIVERLFAEAEVDLHAATRANGAK